MVKMVWACGALFYNQKHHDPLPPDINKFIKLVTDSPCDWTAPQIVDLMHACCALPLNLEVVEGLLYVLKEFWIKNKEDVNGPFLELPVAMKRRLLTSIGMFTGIFDLEGEDEQKTKKLVKDLRSSVKKSRKGTNVPDDDALPGFQMVVRVLKQITSLDVNYVMDNGLVREFVSKFVFTFQIFELIF